MLTRAQLVRFAGSDPALAGDPSPARLTQSVPLPREPKFASLNRKALDDLAAWVPVLLPTAKASHQGYSWTSKAIGRDLEERISFHPKGIKDFGIADMGDPLNGRRSPVMLVAEYVTDGDTARAAQMLAQLLNTTPSGLSALRDINEQPPAPPPPAPFTDPNAALGTTMPFELTTEYASFMFSDAMRIAHDDLPFLHTGISQYGLANWRIASPKTGKTVLVYEETLRGLMGLPMFGQLLKCETKADWAIIYAFEDNPKPAQTLLRRQYKEICKDTGRDEDDSFFKDLLSRIAIICPNSREFREQVLSGNLPDMRGGDYLDSIEPLTKTAKTIFGPNGIVVVDTFEEMTGFLNGMSKGIAELDMTKVNALNDKALHLHICMLVTHHLTKAVNRNVGGDMSSYIAGTYGIESKLNNYLLLKGPTDDEYKKGIKDLTLIHKSRLRDLDGLWFNKIPRMLRPQGHIFLPVTSDRKPGALSDDAEALRAEMVDQLHKYFKVAEFMAVCNMSRIRVQRALIELENAKRVLKIAKTPQFDVYCIQNSLGHKAILKELQIKDGDLPNMGLPDLL